jgi:hypothetical protein
VAADASAAPAGLVAEGLDIVAPHSNKKKPARSRAMPARGQRSMTGARPARDAARS